MAEVEFLDELEKQPTPEFIGELENTDIVLPEDIDNKKIQDSFELSRELNTLPSNAFDLQNEIVNYRDKLKADESLKHNATKLSLKNDISGLTPESKSVMDGLVVDPFGLRGMYESAITAGADIGSWLASFPIGMGEAVTQLSVEGTLDFTRIRNKMEEAQRVPEQFDALQPKTLSGRQFVDMIALPFQVYHERGVEPMAEYAAEKWGTDDENKQDIRSAVRILGDVGLLVAPEGVKRGKTKVFNSDFYRKATIKERGLVVLEYEDLRAKGYTEAQLARMNPEFFERSLERRKVELPPEELAKVEEKPIRQVRLEREKVELEAVKKPEAIERIAEIDKEITEIAKPVILEEIPKEITEKVPLEKPEVKPIIEEPIKIFTQELQTVRNITTEPDFKPENIGLTAQFTSKEISTALDKALKNKKLNPREVKIYVQALSHAHERLSDELAKRPIQDLEQFVDDSITKSMEQHISKAEQEKMIVKTIKDVVSKGTKGKTIVTDEAILLRKQLRDEARGARVAKRVTRQQLLKEFRRSNKNLKDTRKLMIDFIKQELPIAVQGKFIKSLQDDLTLKKQASIFSRVTELQSKLERKELITQSKELAKPKGNVDIEYRKRINEIVSDLDFTRPTQKTLDRLNSLADYLERNPENNVPPERIESLKRLTKKNINDLTTDEMKELRDDLISLNELGKLKRKLKLKYNEREHKLALDRLIASTRNIDPILTGKEKLDKFKRGTLSYYLNTMHTPRVADFIDNYQGYTGENAKIIKSLGAKETDAKFEINTIVTSATEQIKELDLPSFTEVDQARIMINIRNQEGAFEQVKTLMVKHGYKEIPEISVKEQELINILQKHTTANVNEIGAIREEVDNEIFNKLDNYILPIKYERDFNLPPQDVIKQTYRRKRQVSKSFVFERQEGVKQIPRTDILNIFDEAINEQQWYLKIQPELENFKQIVLSKEYMEAGGEFASNFWSGQLDIVARRGWSASANHNPITQLLSQARTNINNAVLGYKLSSILMQPFAVFDAMAYMQSRYGSQATMEVLKEFSNTWVNPEQAKEFINTSKALQTRKGGEIAIEETLEKVGTVEGFRNSLIRGGMSLLQSADLRTAAGVQKGVLNVLEKNSIADAEREAEFIMNIVSGSAEVTYRPQVLASGEGARTWFTFQTFFLNRWGIMAHDLIADGLITSKQWNKKMAALIGLGIFMAGSIIEEEAREFMFEKITGKELPDKSPLINAATAIPSNVPYFGNIFEAAVRGGDSDPPAIRTVENLIRGGVGIVKGKKPETKVRGALKLTESALVLSLGIPGTAQSFDLFEGIFLRPENRRKIKRPKITRR